MINQEILMMGNKYCIIGVYFGKLPRYFPLWLKSCEQNEKIDFLIFTDQHLGELPRNVREYAMSLDEMRRRASEILGFTACLSKPYKCCDYKVLYGLIFRDYIREYEYWGHCDFDLIFGDLCHFFHMYEISHYDRFLALGHLAMYRNTKEVNKRYITVGNGINFQRCFTSDDIYGIDELKGLRKVYLNTGAPVFTKRIFADISNIYRRYRLVDVYPLDKKPKNYRYQIFYWENGKVYRTFYHRGKKYTEEYIYIHFQKRPDFEMKEELYSAEAFYITPNGFVRKVGDITIEIIKSLNPSDGAAVEVGKFILFRIKRLLVKLQKAPAKL